MTTKRDAMEHGRLANASSCVGQAIPTDGELQLETLFRFKGQAADCVVIAEVDFDQWSDDARRRLFVGLTRARLKVSLVASSAAAGLIADRLG